MKEKYNRWLFKKYGYKGFLLNTIPLIYKIIPLFSLTTYIKCMGEDYNKHFKKGFNDAKKILEEVE